MFSAPEPSPTPHDVFVRMNTAVNGYLNVTNQGFDDFQQATSDQLGSPDPESTVNIFKVQSEGSDAFHHGGPKLITLLEPVAVRIVLSWP
jgi:hypothetical protein